MKTSYFAKYKEENGISIARYTPKWFNGKTFIQLAPSSKLLNAYKNNIVNEEEYEIIYREETLSQLNAKDVYETLNDSVLLCYEKSDVFCHRHIVRKWIFEELNIKIEEL